MLQEILIAIQLSHPNMSAGTLQQYAQSIDQQAVVAGVNPLDFVAIIEHESRFRPYVKSFDREDFGLMQVRARYFKGKAEWLFNPVVNIQAGAHVIKGVVSMCEKHLGRKPTMSEYGSCYLGQCGSKASFCRPTKKSTLRERYRNCLANVVAGNDDIKTCKAIYN
jgi:hypothetical protein